MNGCETALILTHLAQYQFFVVYFFFNFFGLKYCSSYYGCWWFYSENALFVVRNRTFLCGFMNSASHYQWLIYIYDILKTRSSYSKVRKYMKKWSKVTQSCWLFATPWSVAHQAPWSMGFSRREYWSGLTFLSPADLPNPGIKPRSPAL